MDIALRFSEQGDFDLVVKDRDLMGDPGPVTPITISLYSDRVARTDDPLPEIMPGVKTDRGGWWGDLVRSDGRRDPIGSRLWLLSREKETRETVARAKEYVTEGLAWAKVQGGSTKEEVTDEGRGRMKIDIQAKFPWLENDEGTDRWTAIIDLKEPLRSLVVGG
jgi:phage gp46-like protein